MPLRTRTDASALPPGTAACLGAFDGLHLGHRALLARAREIGERVALVTFEPHPAQVLAPTRAPPLLTTAGQRARILEHLGVEELVLLPFDRTVAQLSPRAFVERYLLGGLAPAAVIVGHDFRFGRDRAGDPEALADLLGPQTPVRCVDEVPAPTEAGGGELSSSRIRAALSRGDVALAGALLGRWHAVEGVVERGARRGRELGFPTANVAAPRPLLPRPGIYAGALSVLTPGPAGPPPASGSVTGPPYPAAISLGTNPTFTGAGPAPLVLEAHVPGADLGESLYGARVEVSFIARLRDELRFDSAAALIAQVRDDMVRTVDLVDAGALARVLPP